MRGRINIATEMQVRRYPSPSKPEMCSNQKANTAQSTHIRPFWVLELGSPNPLPIYTQQNNARHPEQFFQRKAIRYLLKTYKIIKPRLDFKMFYNVFNCPQMNQMLYQDARNDINMCIQVFRVCMYIIDLYKIYKISKVNNLIIVFIVTMYNILHNLLNMN